MPSFNHAIVLGKFMPPHKGHGALIEYASRLAPHITVVVDKTTFDTMTPEFRAQILKEQFPNVHVVPLTSPTPQAPNEHPAFWEFWAQTLLSALKTHPTLMQNSPLLESNTGPYLPKNSQFSLALVGSEFYIVPLSEALHAHAVLFDQERKTIPISATQIRSNPASTWDYLLPVSARHLARRVLFLGPESTGKSTTAKALETYAHCARVAEWAEQYFFDHPKAVFSPKVAQLFLTQQQALIDAAVSAPKRHITIIDSAAPTTFAFAKTLNLTQDPFDSFAPHFLPQDFHHTFIFSPDQTVWMADGHRNRDWLPLRERHFELYQEICQTYHMPFTVIDGPLSERTTKVQDHLHAIFSNALNPPANSSPEYSGKIDREQAPNSLDLPASSRILRP